MVVVGGAGACANVYYCRASCPPHVFSPTAGSAGSVLGAKPASIQQLTAAPPTAAPPTAAPPMAAPPMAAQREVAPPKAQPHKSQRVATRTSQPCRISIARHAYNANSHEQMPNLGCRSTLPARPLGHTLPRGRQNSSASSAQLNAESGHTVHRCQCCLFQTHETESPAMPNRLPFWREAW